MLYLKHVCLHFRSRPPFLVLPAFDLFESDTLGVGMGSCIADDSNDATDRSDRGMSRLVSVVWMAGTGANGSSVVFPAGAGFREWIFSGFDAQNALISLWTSNSLAADNTLFDT